MRLSPAIFFIKTHVQHYISIIVAKEYSTKKPLFYADAFNELSVSFRQSSKADFFNFLKYDDYSNFSPLGLAENSVISCLDYKEWFGNIDKQPKGLIVASRKKSIKSALNQQKHDVLLISSSLKILSNAASSNKELFHYYSFIDFENGNIFHMFSTLKIAKHHFAFSNFKAEEKTRVSRKFETHQRNFLSMSEAEKKIVGAAIINELIK